VSDTTEELAGEYVLGALEAEERTLVESRMRAEPDFSRSVDAWSRRLTPLSDRVAPVMPPASVWASVQRRIGGAVSSISRRQSDGVWLDVAPGVKLKMLHVNPVTGERTGLMRMEPGSAISQHDHPEAEECFVVEGVVDIDGRAYRAGDYTISYAGSRHEAIRSAAGGLLLLHWNALATSA
jgi:quercetin dioxygenase-like cupin family protein